MNDLFEPEKGRPAHPAKALRRKALALIGTQEPKASAPLGPEATQRLLHELRMHQLELELQNLELRRAQEELETSRLRYADLYDHAPVGYLTLNKFGMILDANLTAALLLGLARRDLHRQPLVRFILPEDQDIYYFHRNRHFANGAADGCELRLLREGGPPFRARLAASYTSPGTGDPTVYRVVISDMADRITP